MLPAFFPVFVRVFQRLESGLFHVSPLGENAYELVTQCQL
ncbi:hypothetical protein BIFBRE_03110 [Bifidobacterium breve DSM 20213 = JCM 1192]|uniref:Uncharacterized protein n=1 Tax=Bifidobacterium breve DSM 20213 = JCM 1192 TaxID=518634 RepID=D4BM20_BIFBR|nr:hypothetical protein BIFBRE_03110 [Bifidobacterium breve DSM 20213 = JCM 1192]